ncbi:MAG TPA: DUF2061 domain-containing protein [Polyangia bacterium]|nr:DUF2061 domain-containing protein [Polyangia bacterium]
MYRAALHGRLLTHTRRLRPPADETFARSTLKAITYRLLIVSLDFAALYLFTHRLSVAVGFTIASNVYTTVAYLVHERLWANVAWGRNSAPEAPSR